MKNSSHIHAVARERFGFDELRPGQLEAIRSVLEGQDTLAVMPTGSGKSAIYQIPAVMLEGPTVVVSPLIALQKDQVDSIEDQDVAPAAVLNSVIPASERREALEDLERDLEFLFLAPEQFNKQETLDRVRDAKPSMFVVDEAHCISEWGHDFRPDYLKLGAVIDALGHPAILALTATANPGVREEIVERLGMRNARVVVRGFDRPNISLEVRAFPNEAAKRDALIDAVEEAGKPGIVYVSSRRHAEEVAHELSERGISALHYHGGMRAKDRDPAHNDFMNGEADVIVATSAFGMGVDKPDVRFVFHYDAPDSLDSYYQEIGRGGRDGRPARAALFYRPEDLNIHRFLKGGGKVDEKEIGMVMQAVERGDSPANPDEIREETGLSKIKLGRAISRLEETGALRRLPTGEVEIPEEAPGLAEASALGAAEQRRLQEQTRLRIEKMQAYAELAGCRREYLLHHFGEDFPGNCGNCDNCNNGVTERAAEAARSAAPADPSGGPFPLKSRVVHKEWGKGVVEEYEREKMIVLFDQAGRKTLSMEAVVNNNLLEAAS